MGEMLQLRAVVEAPCPPTRLVYPWAIAKIKPFSMIRLSVETSPEEIGLIIFQLADYNKASISADARDTIDQILALDGAVLPGGIQIHGEGEKTISPGCCTWVKAAWCNSSFLSILKTCIKQSRSQKIYCILVIFYC